MMNFLRRLIAGAMGSICLLGVAGTTSAQELRLGVAKHDLTDKEDGVAVQAQIAFDNNWLGYLDSYVTVSRNSEGIFNTGGAGVMVSRDFAGGWFAELQFGVLAHDGRTDLPPPNRLIDGTDIDPADVNNPDVLANLERRHVLDNEKTYGCEVLFQTQPSIGRRLNDRWSVAIYWEHLSHGKILCPDGKNEGLDNLGARVSRKF